MRTPNGRIFEGGITSNPLNSAHGKAPPPDDLALKRNHRPGKTNQKGDPALLPDRPPKPYETQDSFARPI